MNNIDPDKERLWKQIESHIKSEGLYCENNREVFFRALKNLPEVHPERDIWESVQKDIRPSQSKTRRIYRYTGRVAATIGIFIASFLAYMYADRNEPRESINANKVETIDSFLSQICLLNPPKCNEPDFMELRSEIIELSNVKLEVTNSIFANSADIDIIKTNERIERQIGNLKNQIIEYVE